MIKTILAVKDNDEILSALMHLGVADLDTNPGLIGMNVEMTKVVELPIQLQAGMRYWGGDHRYSSKLKDGWSAIVTETWYSERLEALVALMTLDETENAKTIFTEENGWRRDVQI